MSHSYADECPGCGSAEMLEEIARLRANGYRRRGRYRQYSKDGAEFHLGMMGEKAFHIWSGLDMNLDLRGKDGGHDFTTEIGTVDVKTYRKAYRLLRQCGLDPRSTSHHNPPDILVLAQPVDGPIKLWGWEYDAVMVTKPKRQMIRQPNIPLTHYMPRESLHTMTEMADMIEAARPTKTQGVLL
tara:strand:+ start:2846 stop:3397 length:552 start_codon:yes stop_codon:yes gene_type:complete